MSDYPIKQGAVGSVSGFDLITKFNDPTLSETDFSIDELLAYLRQLDSLYGPERLRTLQKTILNHVRDFNNPHKDTLDMLADGDISNLMRLFMPGTVPKLFPLVSLEAAFDLTSPFLPMAVARDSELYVVDRQGFLKYVGVNNIDVDWSNGFPIYPCWPETQQLIDILDISANTNFTLINTTSDYGTDNGIVPVMFATQIDLIETASQGEFGFSMAAPTYSIGSEYTYSAFFFPHVKLGTYVFRIGSLYAFIDIATLDVVKDDSVKVHIQTFPNGWWRIGIQFVVSEPSATLDWRFYPNAFSDLTSAKTTSLGYKGTSGRTICSVFGPQLTTGPGLAPYMLGSSMAATTLTFPGYDEAMPTTTGILSLQSQFYPSLTDTSSYNVLSAGTAVSLSISNQVLSGTVASTTPSTSFTAPVDSENALTTFTLSYAPNKISVKSSNSARQDTPVFNTTPLDNIASVSFGPFPGGVCAFSLWAVQDDDDALSFLTGDSTSG